MEEFVWEEREKLDDKRERIESEGRKIQRVTVFD